MSFRVKLVWYGVVEVIKIVRCTLSEPLGFAVYSVWGSKKAKEAR